MYRQHVPAISEAMRDSPEGFVRGCMFAILSIRQPVTAVPDQMAVLFGEAEATRDTEPLFGSKWQAWAYLSDPGNAARMWEDVCAKLFTRKGARAGLLRLLEVPGLGIVKAGFILQMLGHDVACLDTRNVKREGRNPRAFRTDGRKPAALVRKVDLYLNETYGHAERYWDQWCTEVAGYYDMTPEAVSALHLSVISATHVPF
jgi:hypothetical protein